MVLCLSLLSVYDFGQSSALGTTVHLYIFPQHNTIQSTVGLPASSNKIVSPRLAFNPHICIYCNPHFICTLLGHSIENFKCIVSVFFFTCVLEFYPDLKKIYI